jgi:DNA-binding transcriptional LysR family regulator
MINLFYLKTFVAVTKTRSFRITAERNAITQPAVSQHIRILERTLETPLFERRGKTISLTPAGQTFLPYAEGILRQYEEAKMRVREMDNKFSGTIRIATIYSVGLYEMKTAVGKFIKKYPHVHVHMEYHHNTAIYEMVINRSVDFGIVAFPQRKNGIVTEILVEDNLVFIQSPLHRIIKKKSITLKDIDQVKFISFSHTIPTGKTIYRFFSDKKIHPHILHEYDNIELIKNAAVLGLGCALLPRNTISRELNDHSLEIIHVEGLDIKRPIGILYPKGKIFTKSTRTFHDMLTAQKSHG